MYQFEIMDFDSKDPNLTEDMVMEWLNRFQDDSDRVENFDDVWEGTNEYDMNVFDCSIYGSWPDADFGFPYRGVVYRVLDRNGELYTDTSVSGELAWFGLVIYKDGKELCEYFQSEKHSD